VLPGPPNAVFGPAGRLPGADPAWRCRMAVSANVAESTPYACGRTLGSRVAYLPVYREAALLMPLDMMPPVAIFVSL
jgi:hypothetical protein